MKEQYVNDQCEAKSDTYIAPGNIVATTVKIDVGEMFDLDTGYAREGWHEFLWLSGWRAKVAVFVLKLLR